MTASLASSTFEELETGKEGWVGALSIGSTDLAVVWLFLLVVVVAPVLVVASL